MTSEKTTSAPVVLSRIFWMLLGPLILFLLAFRIVDLGSGWFTAVDIAFLVVLAALVLARALEFRTGNAQLATGEPATTAHFYRYAFATVAIGLAVWVAANYVGNHWLDG